jgi:NitT/TauT family transport system substrate-binding protein
MFYREDYLMEKINFMLLRCVCQTPAYAACINRFFQQEGLETQFKITPTAWMVPQQLASGDCDFSVLPWTRVAVAEAGEAPLRVVCGSGYEEGALVVRSDLRDDRVRTVAVPREGGIKDLTAMALIHNMGWQKAEQLRYPSGDGAIIAFFGGVADAAYMVEPYATMFEQMGMGRIVKRTGDVWKGAPGCSLACRAALIEQDPDLVQRVVRGYIRAASWVLENPDEAAVIAAPIIGVKASYTAAAIKANPPQIDGIRNRDTMRTILEFMKSLGYIDYIPEGFVDLRFMDVVASGNNP